MQPLIGISAHKILVADGDVEAYHHAVNTAYIKAVRKAGGIPVLLPIIEAEDDVEALLSRVDALVMTGGGDVDPANYSAVPDSRTTRVDPARDAHDIALCRAAVEADLPTLAICRGSQVLNVALGGSLVQHVDDHFDVARYNVAVHEVDVDPSSRLSSWAGSARVGVNTLHHQALGPRWWRVRPTGRSRASRSTASASSACSGTRSSCATVRSIWRCFSRW
jgi:gamma-glutamyl-gamma-aminobutyrate hydrolase PuuD